MLGIPVPPIFVSERPDSKWDVIDGLQRISTILQLMGELNNEKGSPKEPLILTKTHYLPSLDGLSWTGHKNTQTLSEAAQIRIKRARLDINIVKSTSDQDVKYEIFQRLNTGGSSATDQEVRNCLLLMTDDSYFTWMKGLADYEPFQASLALTENAIDEAFDMELVARFVVFTEKSIEDLQNIDELGSFLNRETVAQAKNKKFRRDSTEKAFKSTFDFLAQTTHENSFRRYDSGKKIYTGPMLVSLFEVIAAGLGHRLLRNPALPDEGLFKKKHKLLWSALSKESYVGSGIRASTRIPKTIDFGREWAEM